MARDTITRAHAALDAGPNPYAHLDVGLATKLGGALYLIGIAYGALVLPLSRPSGPLGALGVAACMAAAMATGLYLLRRRAPASPNLLLAFCYCGIVVTAFYRAGAGAGSSFQQLLFLATMYAAAVHPARRALGVVLAGTLAAVSPLLYQDVSGDFAALTISHVALTWSLAVVILVWTTRVRSLRRELEAAREEAELHARVDTLTGLGNRRALEESLPAAVAAAHRHEHPLSVLVADLDGFKGINDTFGHHAGDDMLRAAARAFTAAVRVPDPCFRWGGDELVALLPGADLDEAREIAARVRSAVALTCRCPDGRPLQISSGIAELRDGETGADAIARADAALLDAKTGRAAAA